MSEKRMFEFVEGSSSKFWEVWRTGSEVRTRYGKIGTSGQVTVKDEGTEEKGIKLYSKLITEKTKKGYVEKTAGGAPAPAAVPVAPAAKPAKAAKDEEDDEDEDASAWRRFEVDEKFWMIKLDGASHTVRFGKIGTDGAEKTKDFADEDAAQKDYDKLVKEKTKKGYEETDG